jgi:hypothetical protein
VTARDRATKQETEATIQVIGAPTRDAALSGGSGDTLPSPA